MDDKQPRRGRFGMWWLAGLALVGAIIAVVAGISSDLSFLPLVGVAVLGAVLGAVVSSEVVGLVREFLEELAEALEWDEDPPRSPRLARLARWMSRSG
jgi:uncharacterized membrane protein